MVTVRIPSVMRGLTGGAATVTVQGGTVREVLEALDSEHPGLARRVLEGGRVRRFVNVFVDDEDIRHGAGLDTRVADGQTVSIIPAVAGGASHHRFAEDSDLTIGA